MTNDIEKFVLVSMPRNGSHYLRGLLNSHEQVSISPEVLIEMHLNEAGEGSRNKARHPKMKPSALGRYYGLNTRQLLNKVYREYNGLMIQAYQTRVKKDSAGEEEPGYKHNDLWDRLQKDNTIKRFIYLKRRNALHVFVSQLKANKTCKWQMYSQEELKQNDFKVEFNAKRFFGYTKWFQEKHELNFKKRFCIREKVLRVYYEDVIKDPQSEGKRILSFLGVEGDCELKPSTLKQESKKMKDVISNFDEACDTLKGTEYEQFLDT
jgi:hypothetical protein